MVWWINGSCSVKQGGILSTNLYKVFIDPPLLSRKLSFGIVRLSLLTITNLNHMREMLLFVCSKMAD